MKSALTTCLLLAAGLGSTTAAVAQMQSVTVTVKIGYVNSDAILRDSLPAKAAQNKLQAEFSKRDKELVDSGRKLKEAVDRYEREQATLVESEKTARQRLILDQEKDLQRKRREYSEDLNQRKNEELQTVVEAAQRSIRRIAEAEGYDFVLQEVVYASPKVDITKKVIDSLNASGGK